MSEDNATETGVHGFPSNQAMIDYYVREYEEQTKRVEEYVKAYCPTLTPLQAIARAIKALSYRDMQRLADLIGNENCGDWAADILAAADKLEAAE